MDKLFIGGPGATDEVALDREALARLPERHQVPDVGRLVEGRSGTAVRCSALAELVRPGEDARFVHVASEDGSFTANVDVDDVLRGGLILYALEGQALPARFGGPFRLLFLDSEDCSVSVKALGRVEFRDQPGSHTARCAD